MTNPDLPRTTYEARDHATQYNAETQIFGATSEEVRAQIAAATAPLVTLNSAQQAEIVRRSILVHEAGLTYVRLLTLARRAGEVENTDQAIVELDRLVTVAIEVQTRGALGSNTGDFVDVVLARMAALSAEDRDAEAAAEADRAFAEWQQGEDERRRFESQRGIAILEAGLRADILRRDAESAARRIARRVELETPDAAGQFANLIIEWRIWYVRGRDEGVNLDLDVSIALARLMRTTGRDADERGAALHSLGVSLLAIGKRETGATRLQEALEACVAALQERTRERVPLDWARTEMNRGAILAELGEREQSQSKMEDALNAYRLSYEELSNGDDHNALASLKSNIGISLAILGTMSDDISLINDSVDAFRSSLQQIPQTMVPIEWAKTQMHLGNALRLLGERERNVALIEEAVDAYRLALGEPSFRRVPLNWAGTQMNMGAALAILGNSKQDAQQMEDAVFAFRAALEVGTRERAPFFWAQAQSTLGNALFCLGICKRDTARLEEAVTAFQSAVEEWTREREPRRWAVIQVTLSFALKEIAHCTGQSSSTAVLAIDAALQVFRSLGGDQKVLTVEAIRRQIAGD